MKTVSKCTLPETICITGAFGQIGSRLTEDVVLDGSLRVRAVRRPNSKQTLRVASNLVETESADIRDLTSLLRAFDGCTYVVHLAAETRNDNLLNEPAQYLTTNVFGTANVARACVESGIRKLIISSTAYVYGNDAEESLTESAELQPESNYAFSKMASELAARSVTQGLDCEVLVMRPTNVYGPNSKKFTLIGSLMEQVARGQDISVEDPSPIRDFIHVNDVSSAIMGLLKCQNLGSWNEFNISTNVGYSIGDVASIVAKLKGSNYMSGAGLNGDEWKEKCESKSKLVLNNHKLINTIDWRPIVGLEHGLNELIRVRGYGQT